MPVNLAHEARERGAVAASDKRDEFVIAVLHAPVARSTPPTLLSSFGGLETRSPAGALAQVGLLQQIYAKAQGILRSA